MKLLMKNETNIKDLFFKLITVVIIASMGLVLLNVMTQSKDGRKQIVDHDGGTEYIASEESTSATREELRLSEILSGIKGVGEADVFITYRDNVQTTNVFSSSVAKDGPKINGVIVTAEGANNVIIKNDIINAVACVFNISAGNVTVFEKE
ncbi:hypothetical protein [Anaerovorax sp. IOR16]|uniref:hypothetical protein n=1 Tax=Anaerovorax sp. IOR16 TaxID=2773458 RepID=UPI0019D16862|nr:hypothetical protein [Anaerovorax sp. IOR16]